jgi:hypothetical protein
MKKCYAIRSGQLRPPQRFRRRLAVIAERRPLHCGDRLRDLWLGRREEGEYPQWSLTDEQQSTRPKSAQPSGLGRRRRLAALLAR